jgi:hypothetical protein
MSQTTPPTQFELAILAATVARGTEKTPLEAIAYALDLWRDSGEVLWRGGALSLQHERAANAPAVRKSWREAGMMPPRFPATLDNFLRLIVRAKTPADSMKRLRDFFRDQHARNPELYEDAAERIGMMKDFDKRGGYFTDFSRWHSMAGAYEIWWADRKSQSAHDSAKKRRKLS